MVWAESVNSHSFAGEYPDPGSQNVAEPKDPNPKHELMWLKNYIILKSRRSIETLYHSLRDCSDASMDPVIVTPEGFISINR